MDWRGRFRGARRVPARRRVGVGLARLPSRAALCKSAAPTAASAVAQAVVPSAGQGPQHAEGLLEGFCAEPRHEGRLAVNAAGRLLLIRLADIDWLEAEGGHVVLHTGKGTHVLSDSLAAVAGKLPPKLFVSLTPSVVVSLRQVRGLRRLCQGEWQVLLRDGRGLAPQFMLGEAALIMAKCRRAAPDQIPSA
jgi:DNA-binding LytR/AlgR family response regulator